MDEHGKGTKKNKGIQETKGIRNAKIKTIFEKYIRQKMMASASFLAFKIQKFNC